MNPRLINLIKQFDRLNIDAFLVTNTANIRYLTYYQAEAAWLLVTPKQAYYLTDGRFTLEARKGLENIPVLEANHPFAEPITRILAKAKIQALGFDENHMSVSTFKKVQQVLPKAVRMVPCRRMVEGIREIKEKAEVASIRQAIKINLALFRHVTTFLKPGMTERQVLFRIEDFVRRHRAGFSFDSIVASGPNTRFPHARVTDRRIKKGEPVLIDTGIDLKGYKSDLTRMFFMGKIPAQFQTVREAVAVAQTQAIKKIRPGISAADVDQEARNYLESQGLARFFSHSLGHGVGLEIHEEPRISLKSKTILQPGMVFTVEPGVYLPDSFGVRIEDMVLVTDTGCEVLSKG